MAAPKRRGSAIVPPSLPDSMKAAALNQIVDEPDEGLEESVEAPSLASFAQQDMGAGIPDAVLAPADDLENEDEDFAPVDGSSMSIHQTTDALPVHPMAHEADPTPWVDPTNLDAPPPRPGYVQRWIRVQTGQRPDAQNASRKMREGWTPRQANTVPAEYHPPTISHGRMAGIIGVEGLILCEMPEEQAARRRVAHRAKIDRQTETIDQQLLMVQQPGNPILRSAKTVVSVGKRIPRVAD